MIRVTIGLARLWGGCLMLASLYFGFFGYPGFDDMPAVIQRLVVPACLVVGTVGIFIVAVCAGLDELVAIAQDANRRPTVHGQKAVP